MLKKQTSLNLTEHYTSNDYLEINEMKKIFSIIVALWSLTFIVNAQTFDPVLASELQNKIDSIRTANNLKGISASCIYP